MGTEVPGGRGGGRVRQCVRGEQEVLNHEESGTRSESTCDAVARAEFLLFGTKGLVGGGERENNEAEIGAVPSLQ